MAAPARPQPLSQSTLMLTIMLAVAYLLLIVGRIIGLADASDNDFVEDDVKASWWLIEIGTWVVASGLTFVALLSRTYSIGARVAMVLVGAYILVSPNLNTLFGGFGF